MPTNVNAVPALAGYRPALESLGYGTVEELVYASEIAGTEIAEYLGLGSVQDLNNLIANVPAANAIPANTIAALQMAEYTLGVELDKIPRFTQAPAFTPLIPAAPPAVDLTAAMPPIRNQAQRGTCVAHAALSAFEHFLSVHGAPQDTSEQFLYWNCKQSDGIPQTSGTWLAVAIPLLKRDGVCLEGTWNYHPNPVLGNEGQGPPPPGARLEALSFRPTNFRRLAPTSVTDIKAELAAGRPVAFSVPVFNVSFFNRNTVDTGDIIMPPPNTPVAGGHAMCFCGYQDDPAPGLGGGRFILRNSWGNLWGVNSPFGAGYGTIPYAYIARFGSEAFSVI